jgi:hypothetical protein
MDLQRISDELEITALLNRYARAVDTKDWDLYRSVFTHDAHIDYSSAGAIAGSREQVADWLAQGFAGIPMSMHYSPTSKPDRRRHRTGMRDVLQPHAAAGDGRAQLLRRLLPPRTGPHW